MPLAAPAARPTILLVDDDSSIRQAVACGLKDIYTVHAVATGREAFGCLCRHSIAAILLDVFLDGEYGLDLVPRFHALSEAPLVILTGHGSEEVAVRALRVRAVDYLTKPFTLTALKASLANAIQPAPVSPDPQDPLVRVHDHFVTHLRAPHTARGVAKEVGVSERHLRRVFHEACGHTPRRHLLLLRLRQAADLLRRSSLAVKEVVDAVGFPSLRSFGRAFAQTYGVSPAAFRRQLRPRAYDLKPTAFIAPGQHHGRK